MWSSDEAPGAGRRPAAACHGHQDDIKQEPCQRESAGSQRQPGVCINLDPLLLSGTRSTIISTMYDNGVLMSAGTRGSSQDRADQSLLFSTRGRRYLSHTPWYEAEMIYTCVTKLMIT